ncbi:checkpoint clamp complex protein Rad1 [Collariella sp. IMI 366227]|nr:checkpoint clamp complex protein Rad1 [Collariella sp. IMI 366227]
METQGSAPAPPIFRAVASSTRPLYQLLKAINFTSKVHVDITENGLRFAADHARVMQADVDPYRSNLRNYRSDAFSNQTLGMSGTCSLSYAQEGEPFSIVLDESGVSTTCNLTTYVPEAPDDIPFDIEDLSFKIITSARWLLDALAELAPTNPEKLTIAASKTEPYLRLTSAGGPLGSSSVDFAKGRDLLETFSVGRRWVQTFKFDIIKSASEAMRIASKVSLRGDGQGVLSMQFMVEVEGSGPSFLDFRFVPYAVCEEEGEEEDEEMGEGVDEEL